MQNAKDSIVRAKFFPSRRLNPHFAQTLKRSAKVFTFCRSRRLVGRAEGPSAVLVQSRMRINSPGPHA
jgi:hypothetical protein